jgi:2-polyprenyl-3-methyl-5-hydroxy-6-metoxy-1,4-benzoquinol methylase
MTDRPCRNCGTHLTETFADLGMSPLSNSFIKPDQARSMEPFYPLHAWVCSSCRLVQLEEFETPASIFSDYLYFSSYSDTWLRHAETYAGAMVERFGLGAQARVVEIASNDGYLLQFFQRHGCEVLGIEPAANVAKVALEKGIPSEVAFFGVETARRLAGAGRMADHMAANNVLAHVPDLNDFVGGFAILLRPQGVVTFEFPHLLRQMQLNQFDTIYHEHFSYLSLHVVRRILAAHGLRVFDVEELSTHGGSLRVFACHDGAGHALLPAVAAVLQAELADGLEGAEAYRAFAEKVVDVKAGLLRFLLDARAEGKRVAAYGAPAKGNTLLNYCGVGPELIAFTVDRSPHKQGTLLPGTRIPVHGPDAILQARPDYVLILPWNLKDEITQQMAAVEDWGGRFVVPIPSLSIVRCS